MPRLIAIFVAVLTLSALIVYQLIVSSRPVANELGKELGKVVGQVAIVTVLGGVLLQEYNRRRARAQTLSEFRKTVFKTLVRSYANAKSTRRLLRAGCRVRKSSEESAARIELVRKAYDDQMGLLNDTQLELEIIIHDLNTVHGAFVERKDLRKLIGKMEHYLNTLVAEYEHALRECGEDEGIFLDRLPRLSDFIHGRKDSYFRKNFTQCFHEALAIIQTERLV